MVYLQPLIFMAGLGGFLAFCLILAQHYFAVAEDPRLSQLVELLPQSNCGACGAPSCRAFAENLLHHGSQPAHCSQSTLSQVQKIADFLQVEVGVMERKVARLACQGGGNVARQRASYRGFYSCAGADLVAGGGKGCAWGCLGLGDCEVACSFDALRLDDLGLPFVTPDKCTACGDCVDACPKGLFRLLPLSQPLFIACKNLLEGEEAEADCAVACTGCGLCAQDSPKGLISMRHFLAVIDETQEPPEAVRQKAIQRCPTGAIGIWNEQGTLVKGRKAKKILNHQRLEVG